MRKTGERTRFDRLSPSHHFTTPTAPAQRAQNFYNRFRAHTLPRITRSKCPIRALYNEGIDQIDPPRAPAKRDNIFHNCSSRHLLRQRRRQKPSYSRLRY